MNKALNIEIFNEGGAPLTDRQRDIILGAIDQVGAMYEVMN